MALIGLLAAILLLMPITGLAAEMVVLGKDHMVEQGENLLDLARANGLGYVEIVAANPGVDPWIPAAGTRILLPVDHVVPPAPRRGIIINVADMRLYFHGDGATQPISFPVGIGKEGWTTRASISRVVGKRKDPTWYVPPSVRAERPELPPVVAPGPDNPLGRYSLDLDASSIRIHGTNRPDGVGRRVSHGCFRLYPEDIERLYPLVAVGTPVTVIDRPAKLAWIEDDLYLEIHPSPTQADDIETHWRLSVEPLPGLDDLVTQAAAGRLERIDWDMVALAQAERRGMPVRITTRPTP